MERWHTKRIVLIGDAAHAMNPQLGMGANLALVDAHVLAQCLQYTRSDEVPNALARYQRLREPQLRYYQRAGSVIAPLLQSEAFCAAWSRSLIAGLTNWPRARRTALRAMCGYGGLKEWQE